MARSKRINPLARAVAVMSAVVIVSGGATYAVLADQAKLTGNTISSISSNSAELVVNNTNDNTFHQTEQGFHFNNLDPGTFSDAKHFQLRNNGDETLDNIRVQITGEEALPSGVDGSDIVFRFRLEDGTIVQRTWAQLIAAPGQELFDDLESNETEDIRVRVRIDDSVTTDNIDISSFDFTFTGDSEV